MAYARSGIMLRTVVVALLIVVLAPVIARRAEAPTRGLLRPGIYVYYDWRNLDPSFYPWIKGSDIDPRWNSVETREGVMDWSNVDYAIDNASSLGKAVFLKVSPHDRYDDGIPAYVYAAGVPRVWVGSIAYPKWWDSTFISKYTAMIASFGQKYNSDPRVSAVAVSIGEYGEAMPGAGGLDWIQNPDQYWINAGLTADIWIAYCKAVVDSYVAAFPSKPLFLQEQGFQGKTIWPVADYAASKGVNMGFNGLAADNDHDSQWYTPFSNYVPEPLMGRLEQGYPNMDQRQTYWAILNALRNHVSIISIYDGPLMDWGNEEAFNFGNKYAGKALETTSGVWSALREADPNVWQTHPGNYEFWLYQLDPAGTSVALFDVGAAKEGMYARRTDQATGKNYLVFDVDDRYVEGGSNHVLVDVTYFDSGEDSFELQYDAVGDPSQKAGLVRKQDSRTWKVTTFELYDARFSNNLRGGDLALYNGRDGDDTFHMVEVTKLNP